VLYGNLVCAGGFDGMTASRVVEVYNPNPIDALGKWTVVAEMPEARAGAAGGVASSRLFVIGGTQTTALDPTTSLFEFDLLDTLPR
jgi:N-acetylneuraminic acid mutarotase